MEQRLSLAENMRHLLVCFLFRSVAMHDANSESSPHLLDERQQDLRLLV
jgi:hypothetical protein